MGAEGLPGAFSAYLAAARIPAFPPLPLPKQLIQAACLLSYRLRDNGSPTNALSVLLITHSAVLSNSKDDVPLIAHLESDLCNLLRGLGRLQLALPYCQSAVAYSDSVGKESSALFRFNLAKVCAKGTSASSIFLPIFFQFSTLTFMSSIYPCFARRLSIENDVLRVIVMFCKGLCVMTSSHLDMLVLPCFAECIARVTTTGWIFRRHIHMFSCMHAHA